MSRSLSDWCQLAQKEQIDEGKGHLYANYRHSNALSLVTTSGLDSFEKALGHVTPAVASNLTRSEDASFGLAQIEVDRAISKLYNEPSCVGLEDYRFAGKTFDWGGVLINLRYSQGGALMSASSGASGYTPPPTPPIRRAPILVWLTTSTHLLKKVEDEFRSSGRRKLSETAFFQSFVSLLGLRPRTSAPIGKCQINFYRLRSGKSLSRPHVFSIGYPERFCGVSPFGSFGATADNRNGKAALPEAVAYLSDLDMLDRTDALVSDIVTNLTRLVDFSAHTLHTLSGEQLVSDLHAQDDAATARKTILYRMRRVQPNDRCSALAPTKQLCALRSGGLCK